MRGTAFSLLPARFLATIGHFMATVMLYSAKDGNIRSSLPLRNVPNDAYNAIDRSISAALWLSWVCFAIELSGFFLGLTMFNAILNLIHTWLHSIAIISTALLISGGWHALNFWYIFTWCSALPATLELIAITRLTFAHI
ncbi:transmembrane protein [Cladochytrium replicatum]|nr:transmembrane protein [Cladochytrium replicatum]